MHTSSRGLRLLCAAAVTLTLPVLAATAPAQAKPDRDFDLQAHRGGIGLTVESTLPAFAKALELGVTTLELDARSPRTASPWSLTTAW